MADGLLNKASIILTPTGNKAGTLYNVAPIEAPYEDFDFARASVASRVNSSGLVEMVGRTLGSELVLNQDFSDWSLGAGWSVVSNRLYFDTDIGSGTTSSPNILEIAKTYKITFDVNITTGVLRFESGEGDNFLIDSTYTSVTHYFVADLFALVFRRNETPTEGYITNVSVKEVIDTNNIPRIRYDSNGDNGHILLEPSSTNLVTYSEDFSQSIWINTYTLTPNSIISPDGSLNAYTITLPSVNGNLRTNVSVSSSTDYIFSFYAKRGTASEMKYRVFDFTNLSDIVSKTSYYSQTDISNWVRIEVPFTTNATTSEVGVYIDSDSQGNGDFYAWGAQLEELSYATSYIPNHGTAVGVTRAAETLTGSGNSTLIDTTQGTIYLESKLGGTTGTKLVSIGGGTNNADPAITIGYTGQNMYMDIVDSGSLIATPSDRTITGINTSSYNKMAIKYTTTNVTVYLNGVKKHTETIDFTPATNVLKALYAGYGTGSKFEGEIKVLAVFDRALNDTELGNLTNNS